jgi:hypothetical protein
MRYSINSILLFLRDVHEYFLICIDHVCTRILYILLKVGSRAGNIYIMIIVIKFSKRIIFVVGKLFVFPS